MKTGIRGPRWHIWLPVAATVAAAVMTGLAVTTTNAMKQRNELALEGRLLGLAQHAEIALRDEGIEKASTILATLLPDGTPDVLGLALFEASGSRVASAGISDIDAHQRSVDLFLGRFAAGGAEIRPGRGGVPGGWGRGRGRYELRLYVDPGAGQAPLPVRMLAPGTACLGIALIWLSVLGGRFLVRQRQVLHEDAERQRLEALARAGAGLAHQLRTPLATIKGTSQLLAESCADHSVTTRLEAVVRQADRMDRLLGQLLDYARPPEPEKRPVVLAEVIAEIVGRTAHTRAAVPTELVANVDCGHLVEILENLLHNAQAASPSGEEVLVHASRVGPDLRIVVADRGPGPGEDPEKLFEPYFSTRADGSGLGLPIARNLAVSNSGWLSLETRDGGGCDAVVILPAEGDA